MSTKKAKAKKASFVVMAEAGIICYPLYLSYVITEFTKTRTVHELSRFATHEFILSLIPPAVSVLGLIFLSWRRDVIGGLISKTVKTFLWLNCLMLILYGLPGVVGAMISGVILWRHL